MKKNSCMVCEKEFNGRSNQKFCSVDCKNKFHNQKTRLIYNVGKKGKKVISKIQKQINSDNARLIRIDSVFEEEKAIYKSEIAKLKSDYTELLGKYEKFKADLEKVKGKYVDSLWKSKEQEEQINKMQAITTLFAPALDKLLDNLNKTKKDEDTE